MAWLLFCRSKEHEKEALSSVRVLLGTLAGSVKLKTADSEYKQLTRGKQCVLHINDEGQQAPAKFGLPLLATDCFHWWLYDQHICCVKRTIDSDVCSYCGVAMPYYIGARRPPTCRCRQQAYCDANCQRRHWPAHGSDCIWKALVEIGVLPEVADIVCRYL